MMRLHFTMWLTLLLFLSISCTKETDRGELFHEQYLKLTQNKYSGKYLYNQDNASYGISSTYAEIMTESRVNENSSTETSVDRELPNSNRGEFDRVKIKERNEEVIVLTHSLLSIIDTSKEFPLKLEFDVEYEYDRDEFQSFQTGGPMSLKITEQGKENLRKAITEKLEITFSKQMEAVLLAMLSKNGIEASKDNMYVDVDVMDVQLDEKMQVTISQSEYIESSVDPFILEVSLKGYFK